MKVCPTMRVSFFFAAIWTSSLPCSEVWVIGFSMKVCFPACSAFFASS